VPPIPTTIVDNAGVSYAVTFKPPIGTNPVARVEVLGGDGFLVAAIMFGEREPGFFYIDDLQVFQNARRGIGARLLALAEVYGAEHGFSEVHGVIIAYEPASSDCAFLRAWYERHGYIVHMVVGHPRKEYRGHISKKLAPP
jgi:predicted GNAT superfamily acetyltransferase